VGRYFTRVAGAVPVAYLLAMIAPQQARESMPSVASTHDKILIVDFGSQVTQLIARRVREEGVYSEIVPFQKAEAAFNEMKPKAVILSGGPESVHEAGSPRAPQAIFDSGVPVRGLPLTTLSAASAGLAYRGPSSCIQRVLARPRRLRVRAPCGHCLTGRRHRHPAQLGS